MWLKRTLSIVGIKLVRLKQVTFFIFSLRDLSCSILKRVPSLTVHSFQLGTLEGKKKTTAFTVTLVLPLWLQPKMNSNGSPPDLGGISEGWRSLINVHCEDTEVYGGQCYLEQSRSATGSTWFICSRLQHLVEVQHREMDGGRFGLVLRSDKKCCAMSCRAKSRGSNRMINLFIFMCSVG